MWGITLWSLIFDLAAVAVVVICAAVGKKKGLMMMAFSCAIIVIAVVVARLAMPYVSKGMEKMKLGEKIQTSVGNALEKAVGEDNTLDLSGLSEKLNLPKAVTESIEKNVDEVTSAKGTELAEKISGHVSRLAIKLISYLAVALVVVLVLVVISVLLNLIRKLPVIRTFDAVGGALVGTVLGLVLAGLLCILVYAIGIRTTGGVWSEIASGSLLVRGLDALGVFARLLK